MRPLMLNKAAVVTAVSLLLLVAYPALPVPQAVAQGADTPVSITQAPPGNATPVLAGGIAGIIRSDAGSPLGGALVVAKGASTSGTSSETSTFTEPDGSYRLGVGPGSYNVAASARGHEDKTAPVVVSGTVTVKQDLTLEHTGPILKGTVHDGATGKGLAGVTLEFHQDGYGCKGDVCPLAAAMPEFYRMPITTRTDGDGKYAMGVEAGYVNVRAWKDGYRDSWQNLEADAGENTLDLKITAIPPKTAVLEGTVVDAKTGKPLRDAWVSAWPNYAADTQAQQSGAAGSGSAGSAGTTDDRVAASPATFCVDCGGYEGNSTQTDENGRFRMGMYPGTYTFSANAPEHGSYQQAVTLRDNEERRIDAELEPIPGDSVTIRGVVLDKVTGKPIQGAYVTVENQQWGHYNGTSTGSDGRFAMKTKPGFALVWVRIDGGVYYATPVATGTAEPGSTEPAPAPDSPPPEDQASSGASIRAPDSYPRPGPEGSYYPWVRSQVLNEDQVVDLRVEMQPKPKADLRVVGYILNATNKKPLAGASVNIRNEDTGDWGYAQTDKDGSFVILGREGMHTVQAYAEGYFQNAAMVRVEGKETRIDLALQPGRQQGYCCIAYAERSMAAGSESPPPTATPTSASPDKAQDAGTTQGAPASPTAPQTAGFRTSGPATYQAAAGQGLGPYDPSKAPEPASGGGVVQGGGNQTPGPGLLLALAAAGVAAVLVARRKR